MGRGNELGIGPATKNPFWIPTTGILLAKTCPDCGLFLDKTRFRKQRIRNTNRFRYKTQCQRCLMTRQNTSNALKRADGIRRSDQVQLNEITKEHAHRHGKPWQHWEDERIKDNTRTSFSIALEIGRTMFAVLNERRKIGIAEPYDIDPKSEGVWNIRWPKAEPVDLDQAT